VAVRIYFRDEDTEIDVPVSFEVAMAELRRKNSVCSYPRELLAAVVDLVRCPQDEETTA
jgi:hypothetical protein